MKVNYFLFMPKNNHLKKDLKLFLDFKKAILSDDTIDSIKKLELIERVKSRLKVKI